MCIRDSHRAGFTSSLLIRMDMVSDSRFLFGILQDGLSFLLITVDSVEKEVFNKNELLGNSNYRSTSQPLSLIHIFPLTVLDHVYRQEEGCSIISNAYLLNNASAEEKRELPLTFDESTLFIPAQMCIRDRLLNWIRLEMYLSYTKSRKSLLKTAQMIQRHIKSHMVSSI